MQKTIEVGFMLPPIIKENFTIRKIEEKDKEWIIYLEEKPENIPREAKMRNFGRKIVLNGFQKQIELIDHTLSGKLTYLRIRRRRWKIQGTQESYDNHHNLHPKGLKCTHEFGSFLKYIGRYKRRKFFNAFPNIRHIREKDFTMVSRIKRFFSKDDTAETT